MEFVDFLKNPDKLMIIIIYYILYNILYIYNIIYIYQVEVVEFVDFLKNPDKFKNLGAKIPKAPPDY